MSDGLTIIGCGDLGSRLARRLCQDPAFGGTIIGTSTRAERLAELTAAGVTPHVLTLPDAAGLRALLATSRTLLLTVAPRRGASHEETYVAGVSSALEACRGTGVRHILYTSATTVYGQEDGSWVDEDSPTEPTTDRGRALLTAEQILRAGAGAQVTVTVLRLTGIWGPDRGPGRMVDRFAGRERFDGDSFLNLVHRDDIIAALHALVLSPYDGLLNLNDDTPTPRREYYDPLVAARGLEPIRWSDSVPPKLGKRVRNDKIKQELNLKLEHPAHG